MDFGQLHKALEEKIEPQPVNIQSSGRISKAVEPVSHFLCIVFRFTDGVRRDCGGDAGDAPDGGGPPRPGRRGRAPNGRRPPAATHFQRV